jgi:gamma-glutamyl hercynylcysteine S-oxide synthase
MLGMTSVPVARDLTPEQLTPEQWRSRVAQVLTMARDRSQLLTSAVDDDDLVRQHSPLMSPLVWDLAHVGNQEELWLVRDVGGRAPVRQDIDELYDAFKHARADRPALPLLSPAEARHYLREVREKVLDVLEGSPLEGRPLLEDAFAFGMVAQHEQQHDETMLATHQLRARAAALDATPPPRGTRLPAAEVLVPGGPFTMGTSTEPWALDNERPAHGVDVAPFFIDTAAVTNGAYLAFIDDGGYDQRRWWSAQGWAHRVEAGLTAPRFWEREGDTWWRLRFGIRERVPPREPVMHVSFHEAQAYAAWAGRRLPTEPEWEKAARWDPASGRSRRYPWGDEDPGPAHANLGQRHLAPAEAGAYPLGASPLGVHQLIGDVWEWTSSAFEGYPGFAVFPYPEYSLVFFGSSYRVLRGGSFGTDGVAVRGTFRNWDYPIRRQIFAGFRCARDPAPGEAG